MIATRGAKWRNSIRTIIELRRCQNIKNSSLNKPVDSLFQVYVNSSWR